MTKKGIIFKTGRAYFQTSQMSSQAVAYCVDKQSVYDDLQKYANSGEKVVIYYHGEHIVSGTRCNREANIIDVVKETVK